ncbi:MAG TPA: GTP-binding protein, partial [Anaerolineae bacterium]|nr:GTP-binding protein [Anaerolineae bacterium]
MKDYRSDRIHNIALVGHSGAGKTTLTEAALYLTKVTTRMGKTEDGNTVSDFDPEEVRRGISISTSLIPVEWDGHKINFLDTPGYADFVGEVITALAAADYGVVVVDAVAGVEVGTELTWQALDDLGLPRMVVINKMDRDNASAERTLASLREHFPEVRFTPMVLPVGQKAAFQGVYRLNSGKPSLGAEGKEGTVPDDVMQAAATARMTLVEAAAEGEDELMMKYFDEG